jgi:hypothetical protein
MPFFCESQYLHLKQFFTSKIGIGKSFDESIHLVDKLEFVNLGPEQIEKSIDFDIIYNIISQIYQLRSSNDISLKKPIRQIFLVWDDQLEFRYSGRFKEYLGMIMDECNLLDLQILSKSDVSICKSITPVKSLFFKTHGKNISKSFEEINKMNNEQLDKIIETGEFDGFKIESTMFNFNYNVKLLSSQVSDKDLVYKEFDFGNFKDKIIILMDKSWTESNDKIYYYRLVATSIQKSRKNAGLHPWDDINALWEGKPKYSLESNEAQQYIENITRIKLLNYSDNFIGNSDYLPDIQSKLSDLVYSNEFENIGIKIHLAK